MNAGGSPAAQDFTTRYCDMNFVILKDRTYLEGARQQIAHLKDMARSHGRETRIWIHVYVVCRQTEKEAKDYLHHYVYEKGDWEAAGNLLRIFGMQTETLDHARRWTATRRISSPATAAIRWSAPPSRSSTSSASSPISASTAA